MQTDFIDRATTPSTQTLQKSSALQGPASVARGASRSSPRLVIGACVLMTLAACGSGGGSADASAPAAAAGPAAAEKTQGPDGTRTEERGGRHGGGHDGRGRHEGRNEGDRGRHSGGSQGPHAGKADWPHPTLGARTPLVVAHRGLSGLHPEQTAPAYQAAVLAGADSLEGDMHLTKDCKLVLRHNAWLADNTTIAEVAAGNPALMQRRRTTPGRLVNVPYDAAVHGGPAQMLVDQVDPADPRSVLRALVVDGEEHVNDWSISDFTLQEARTWLRGTTYDNRNERPAGENGLYPVITPQELLAIAQEGSSSRGRPISIYLELKNPHWNNQQARANGCDHRGTGKPFEDAVLDFLNANRLNRKDAPVFIQSFDPATLKYLKRAGMKSYSVQLVDGNDVDYRTGEMIYEQPDAWHFVSGRPYSWTLAGDTRYFGSMLTPAGLAEIARYADGIGPWKPQVMRWRIAPYPTAAADGSPYKPSLADVNDVQPTALIADAHAAGLAIHSFTFRNEKGRLPGKYQGDPIAEYLDFFVAGIDGVFTDFTGTAVQARDMARNLPATGKR